MFDLAMFSCSVATPLARIPLVLSATKSIVTYLSLAQFKTIIFSRLFTGIFVNVLNFARPRNLRLLVAKPRLPISNGFPAYTYIVYADIICVFIQSPV